MLECEATIKQWGNSIGVVIPKKEAESEHLKPDQKVRIIVMPVKHVKAGEIFGLLKNWKKPTKEIMREIDEELDN